MGISPVLTVHQLSGGVAAKMISPQSIVVGTSSHKPHREGDLPFALPHTPVFFIVALRWPRPTSS